MSKNRKKFSLEMDRRKFITSSATLALSTAGSAYASGWGNHGEAGAGLFGGHRHPRTTIETRSLDEIYQAALDEGGKLVIYSGGDTPTQQDFTKAMFLDRFPEMDIEIIVDYSKYQDVRLDNQFATNTVVPDVIQLQTLQDFTRWALNGRLMKYKPVGTDAIHPLLRDHHNYWITSLIVSCSYMFDQFTLGYGSAPRSAEELADPRWKGQIASAYPHDDDAVLYLYSLYAQAYGWDWVAAMADQDIRFARGTNTPPDAVRAHEKLIGIGGAGSAVIDPNADLQWVLPESGPFLAVGQRVAILQQAKNVEAAKLYLNWSISKEMQSGTFTGWSVRMDVPPGKGLRQIWEYPNAHLDGFARFMADRAEVERWKQTFSLYFGEVQGPPTPGRLGLHPGA